MNWSNFRIFKRVKDLYQKNKEYDDRINAIDNKLDKLIAKLEAKLGENLGEDQPKAEDVQAEPVKKGEAAS